MFTDDEDELHALIRIRNIPSVFVLRTLFTNTFRLLTSKKFKSEYYFTRVFGRARNSYASGRVTTSRRLSTTAAVRLRQKRAKTKITTKPGKGTSEVSDMRSNVHVLTPSLFRFEMMRENNKDAIKSLDKQCSQLK